MTGSGEVDRPDDAPAGEPQVAGEGQVGAPVSSRWRTALAVGLAWMIPGAGHVFLGHVGRGLLLGAIILTMFAAGVGLDGKLYTPSADDPLTTLAAVAGAAIGAPYLMLHWNGGGAGDIEAALHEYGTTFALTAGLLNLLVVLDAFDVARGRRP